MQDVSLAPAGTDGPDESNPISFWLPYGVTLLFYFLIMGSASLLLSNISKEKENRVIEILLNSVTPLQLLTGKIVGLGLVGLLQTILWFGTGYVLMNLSGRVFSLPVGYPPAASLVVWGIGLFCVGLCCLRQPDGRAGCPGSQPARGLTGHFCDHAAAHPAALLQQHGLRD